MKQSESIKTFAEAFVAAQAEITNAVKDKTNPHFKSRYADLASVAEACKKPLNKQGIAFLQTPEPSENGQIVLTTRLIHKSGEWIEGSISIPSGQNTPQGYGSALTYARRYGLAAITGVCPDDDDAEGAEGRDNRQPDRQQPKPSPRQQAPSEPQTPTQKLQALITRHKITAATVKNWLDAAGVQGVDQLPADKVEKAIKYIEEKTAKKAA